MRTWCEQALASGLNQYRRPVLFLLARAFVRQIRRERLGGVIVYIASKNGDFVGPSNVAYGSVKAAQVHQARLLAAEVGGDFAKTTGAIVPVDGGIPGAFPR